MENRFNDSTGRASFVRRLAPTLAVSLGLSMFTLSGAPIFGQEAQQGQVAQHAGQQPRMVEAARTANAITPMDLSRVFVNVAKRAKPTVVDINVVQAGARQASPRNGQSTPAQGRRETGSGVIVRPDGYILTNNHVAGNANEIKVKLVEIRL